MDGVSEGRNDGNFINTIIQQIQKGNEIKVSKNRLFQ